MSKRLKNRKRKIHAHIHLLFTKWLRNNQHRFLHKPMRISSDEFVFVGINKQVSLLISSHTEESMIAFSDEKGNNYDYYSLDYIETPKYSSEKGWYDAGRISNIEYFKSYDEMLMTNIFEPIIGYSKEYFNDKNSLYLYNYGNCKDCSTSGYIGEKKSLNTDIEMSRR